MQKLHINSFKRGAEARPKTWHESEACMHMGKSAAVLLINNSKG